MKLSFNYTSDGHDSVLTSYPQQEAVSVLSVCISTGLDQYGRLTDPMGMRMAEFPLSPMFAKMLLESGNYGCSKEIVTIAAMMQIQNIFVVPPNQKKVAVSEHSFFFNRKNMMYFWQKGLVGVKSFLYIFS